MVLIWLCHNKRLKFTQATLRWSLAFFPPSSFPSSSPSSLLCVSHTSPLFPSFPSFQPSPLRRCSKMTCVYNDDLSSGTTPPPFYPLTFTTLASAIPRCDPYRLCAPCTYTRYCDVATFPRP